MTTYTIGDQSTSSTQDNLIPPIFGHYPNETIDQEEKFSGENSIGSLIRELYGDLDTSASSQVVIPNYEVEIREIERKAVQVKELNDFKKINNFAEKILESNVEEPLDAQKKTYDKFWDLF